MAVIPARTAALDWDPVQGVGSSSGTTADFDQSGFVRLDAVAGVTYHLAATMTGIDSDMLDLHVYDAGGNELAAGTDASTSTVELDYAAASTGPVYVAVSSFFGYPGTFDLFVSSGTEASHNLGPGDDTYVGIAGERILGGTGRDTITLGNAMLAFGGPDNDVITGNDSGNRIAGGAGDDRIVLGSGDNVAWGNAGADRIIGASGGGNDVVYGGDGSDSLDGGGGADEIHGGGDADFIAGGAGASRLYGDGGNDHLHGQALADILDGGAGADLMAGGDGDDVYYVDNGGDVVDETGTAGDNDAVYASVGFDLAGAARGEVESLTLTGGARIFGYGNELDNRITGNAGINDLRGRDGADTLFGLGGNDILMGGAGGDTLSGGAGADTFRFLALADSTVASVGRDTILDFRHGQRDKINLASIDADVRHGGNQAFDFLGSHGFTGHAGELRYARAGADLILYGDVNGDRRADFTVHFDHLGALQASDFIL